jgi:hypothetical protein
MKSQLRTFSIFILAALLGLLLTACQASIARNEDGSLRIETSMTEAAIQSEIEAALADPLIQSVTVDLQSGYALVSGTRKRLNSDQTDTLTFRLDLGVREGFLTAAISNAEVDGVPVEAERVALWNERIANRLERAGQRRPNSTLLSVTITSDSVTMVWRVETARSRGGG